MTFLAVFGAVALSAAGIGRTAGSAHARWVITDLGKGGFVAAINDHGQIVGTSYYGHILLWQKGKKVDLGTLGMRDVAGATDINNNGQITLNMQKPGTNGYADYSAFLWQKGKIVDLGSLGGTSTSAISINDQGQIVGDSTTADGADHAFLWEDGKMTDLGSLAGESCEALAINDHGQIVGRCTTAEGASHAVSWENGKIVDLDPLVTQSDATDINNSGQIVGAGERGRYEHALLWQNGKMTDLCARCTGDSAASSINDRGEIVGWGVIAPSIRHHALLWQKGKVTDLSMLPGGKSSEARTINKQGNIILGLATTAKEDPNPVLWTLKASP